MTGETNRSRTFPRDSTRRSAFRYKPTSANMFLGRKNFSVILVSPPSLRRMYNCEGLVLFGRSLRHVDSFLSLGFVDRTHDGTFTGLSVSTCRATCNLLRR